MNQLFPIAGKVPSCTTPRPRVTRTILWLQGITLAWMLAECGVSLYAAATARSAALLAFGADSLVELLSACVVLLSFMPSFPITKESASRWAGVLLFLLAGIVAAVAVLSLRQDIHPASSCSGIVITIAALIVMPLLAWFKRKAAQTTGSRALSADAVQSATCAYLAAITLVGLGINAIFHIGWVDSVAALAALPVLILEGRKAMRNESCCC